MTALKAKVKEINLMRAATVQLVGEVRSGEVRFGLFFWLIEIKRAAGFWITCKCFVALP